MYAKRGFDYRQTTCAAWLREEYGLTLAPLADWQAADVSGEMAKQDARAAFRAVPGLRG